MEPRVDLSTTTAPPVHGADGPELSNGTLPPTLTPATTTRSSVALGFLAPLWGTGATPLIFPPGATASTNVTSSVPSPIYAADLPLDLTASIGSIPSATTTLTNTLPPTQSAALRALNAPAFQSHASQDPRGQAAKSTSSRTTLSSQPVVVRTYSSARHKSMASSGRRSPRYASRKPSAPQQPSALSAGLAGRSDKLPSAEDFAFSAILRAVDPEIRDAIDAIAEICAKSRMSLADEYDAHLPPQGEITGTGSGWVEGVGAMPGRGRISRIGQGWAATESTLMAVPEASSSSERLAGGSTAGSSKKRSRSAYGSLKSVISGSSNGKRRAAEDANSGPSSPQSRQGPAWQVKAASPDHPAIALLSSPRASKQLSFDTSSTIRDILEDEDAGVGPAARVQKGTPRQMHGHRRNRSAASLPATHARSTSLTTLSSWLPWPRLLGGETTAQVESTKAESRLREVLMLAQDPGVGKGKATVSVA